MYKVVKTYGHDLGLSCAFRQWKATSHCRFLHGYSLAFEFTFSSETLDFCNWVVDFGNLKLLKDALVQQFDHKTIVSTDDPYLDRFKKMHEEGIIDLVILKNVGCEAFAEQSYILARQVLVSSKLGQVNIEQVKVSEHGANSAIYIPGYTGLKQ